MEKERLESKIADLHTAFETSNNAQAEQQSQIVSLLSQVRELRGVLDEAEAERASLLKARQTLEIRLNDIAQEHVSTSKMSSDRVLQALHLEKQNLQREIDSQTERMTRATDRLKTAEAFAKDCQAEVAKTRMENSQLEKQNVSASTIAPIVSVSYLDTGATGENCQRVKRSRRRFGDTGICKFS